MYVCNSQISVLATSCLIKKQIISTLETPFSPRRKFLFAQKVQCQSLHSAYTFRHTGPQPCARCHKTNIRGHSRKPDKWQQRYSGTRRRVLYWITTFWALYNFFPSPWIWTKHVPSKRRCLSTKRYDVAPHKTHSPENLPRCHLMLSAVPFVRETGCTSWCERRISRVDLLCQCSW
jgi:hypothetical protein